MMSDVSTLCGPPLRHIDVFKRNIRYRLLSSTWVSKTPKCTDSNSKRQQSLQNPQGMLRRYDLQLPRCGIETGLASALLFSASQSNGPYMAPGLYNGDYTVPLH